MSTLNKYYLNRSVKNLYEKTDLHKFGKLESKEVTDYFNFYATPIVDGIEKQRLKYLNSKS